MAVVQFAVNSQNEITFDSDEGLCKGCYTPGLLPITNLTAGQVVSIRRRNFPEGTYTRLSTFSYDEETFGLIDPGIGYSTFGIRTNIQDLHDFDKDSLIQEGDGYVFWDAELGKFKVINTAPQWEGNYTLQDARDVAYRNPETGNRIGDGDILTWDDDNNEFVPRSTNLSFRVNDAEDVDTTNGFNEGEVLVWNDAEQVWKPGVPPNIAAPTLDELSDVEAGEGTVADNYTLLYSEALEKWYAAPAPSAGVDKLTDMRDVDDTGIQDGEVLAWDALEQKYVATDALVPTYIDDLADVETSDRPPVEGQGLQWNGSVWAPGSFLKGGASSIAEMYDVNVDKAPLNPGQALVWGGTYWENRDVSAGQGDGGDWETGLVRVSFTPGVWGGGDWDNTTSDRPMEQLDNGLFAGGGDFF
jgi:hypothetical protein